jgi:hypothetical protein
VHWILNTICSFHFQSRENGQCDVFCSACPYSKIGVVRTVQNSYVTVFCSIPLVFLKSGVLRTVNAATCSKKCLWWLKARSNLNLRAQQQSKFSFLLQYNLLFKNKDMVLFCGCIRVYSTMFYN